VASSSRNNDGRTKNTFGPSFLHRQEFDDDKGWCYCSVRLVIVVLGFNPRTQCIFYTLWEKKYFSIITGLAVSFRFTPGNLVALQTYHFFNLLEPVSCDSHENVNDTTSDSIKSVLLKSVAQTLARLIIYGIMYQRMCRFQARVSVSPINHKSIIRTCHFEYLNFKFMYGCTERVRRQT